jgi:hypothetical protein
MVVKRGTLRVVGEFVMDRRMFFTAAGAAGAIGFSNVNARAAPASLIGPTIFDFGAAGDGVTDDSAAFAQALTAAATSGYVVAVPSSTYAVKNPIRFASSTNVGSAWGLACEGARIVSMIENGADVLTLVGNTVVRYFQLTGGLTITCSGSDGNGLRIFAPSNAYFYNARIEGLSIERAGLHGLLFEGNVFESTLLNCYFQDCAQNGATFAQSHGGVVSAIGVIGCFFNQNGKYGLSATNFDGIYGGTTDVRVYGGYCRDNASYGFYYNNGTGGGCLEQVGFENNCRSLKPGDPNGAHVYGLSAMRMRNCQGYNENGGATFLLRGWFNGLTVLDQCGQDAGGAMAATGASRLVQVNGSNTGHVLLQSCTGGIAVAGGNGCTWEAVNSSGQSPQGTLNIRGAVQSS